MIFSVLKNAITRNNSSDMGQPRVNLFQIAYSDQTLPEPASGYEVLDNRNSPRNDWREYWPIRNFLRQNSLDEKEFYGFLSPRFKEKTGLGSDDIRAYIHGLSQEMDVVLFSPQPDMSAFFVNVFAQNEAFDPGFIAVSEEFLRAIGRPMDIGAMLMDSRNSVYSNYIVAKPAFWRVWLDMCEKLFNICESSDGELKDLLVHETGYVGSVQRKVFLMERIASLILFMNKDWKVRAYNSFTMPWSVSDLSKYPFEAVMCDALKIALNEQGYFHFKDAFEYYQRMVFQSKK